MSWTSRVTASWTIKLVLSIAAAVALGMFIFHSLGCASKQPTANQTLHTALHTMNDTISPLSEITQRACIAKQDAENAAVRLGKSNTADAEKNIQSIRERCNKLRAAFDQIRTTYNEAVDFVNDGYFEQAQAQLKEIQNIWLHIQEEGLLP